MNKEIIDSTRRLANLKRLKDRIQHQCHKQNGLPRSSLGHGGIDMILGGGIAAARLHEIFAQSPADAASAAGFATMLAHQRGGAVFWIRQERHRARRCLYAEGLAEIGLNPARVLLCFAPDAAGVLKAANEAAHCSQITTVVAELWQHPHERMLTISRRLALSAEASGVTLLMLRIDSVPEPSAATTRWSIAAAPSDPLVSNAPGLTALDITLLRQRGRAGEGSWRVLWDRDHGRFIDARGYAAPLFGAVRAEIVLRSAAMEQGRYAA